jgi:hypothetical protein
VFLLLNHRFGTLSFIKGTESWLSNLNLLGVAEHTKWDYSPTAHFRRIYPYGHLRWQSQVRKFHITLSTSLFQNRVFILIIVYPDTPWGGKGREMKTWWKALTSVGKKKSHCGCITPKFTVLSLPQPSPHPILLQMGVKNQKWFRIFRMYSASNIIMSPDVHCVSFKTNRS